MQTKKFKKRVADLPEGLPIVVELKGKLYNILTAKIFNNHSRLAANDEYFCIMASEEIQKEDLKNEKS